jgi:hypothetical protein
MKHTLTESRFPGFFILSFLCAFPMASPAADENPQKPEPASAAILANGDFATVDPDEPGKPSGWARPDGLGVQWVDAPGDDAHGKAIRMDTSVTEKAMVEQWKKTGLDKTWDIPKAANNSISDTYGLSYYSDPFPVTNGQAYRVSFDFLGPSEGAKVWVRGYGEFKGEKRRRYEKVVTCRTDQPGWTHFTAVLNPTQNRPEVTEMKVMLYAFYPPGIYWFDNVRIDPITP